MAGCGKKIAVQPKWLRNFQLMLFVVDSQLKTKFKKLTMLEKKRKIKNLSIKMNTYVIIELV